MTNVGKNKSLGQRVKAIGSALFLIISVTFSWIGLMVKSVRQPPARKTEMFWDMIAKNVDKTSENEGLKQIDIRWDEKTEKYLKKSDVVLDYGCADGILAIKYSGMVKEIHGIDYAYNMIEVAKRKAEAANIENIHFTQALIFDEKLEKESYDAIMARGILHLVDDRREVINRINELLKPDGLFISGTECLAEKKSSITSVLSFLMKIGIFPPMLKFFTVSELEDSVTSANFQMVETGILADNPVAYFIAAKKSD